MNQKNMVHQLDVNQLLLRWINIKEEVLKNIEDKEKQDSVKNLTVNISQVLSGVKFLTSNKYIYGQRHYKTNYKGLC